MSQDSFYADFAPDTQQTIQLAHERRFQQLNGLAISHSEGAMQYLLAVNGGGAAAMLGIIGAVATWRGQSGPYVVLSIFVVGLVLSGCLRVQVLLHMKALLDGWVKDSGDFFGGALSYQKLHSNDDTRIKHRKHWPWVLGWASMGSFVVGCIGAMLLFWKNNGIAATT